MDRGSFMETNHYFLQVEVDQEYAVISNFNSRFDGTWIILEPGDLSNFHDFRQVKT